MSFTFTPAKREGSFARIALAGPSGSGKTWTALILATELSPGRVAVVDTERGSAKKYAGDFAFDVLELQHFDPRDLIKALGAAGQAGYGTVVVDSLSHFWMGSGGMLEQVDAAAAKSRTNNTFTSGWKEMRPVERQMIDALLAYPGHVIATMRTKTDWVIVQDARGRDAPRRVGLKPEQREGMEYEFDLFGELDFDHTLTFSKSRMPALAGAVIPCPGPELAEQVQAWLTEGGPPPTTALDLRDRAVKAADLDGLRKLYLEAQERGLEGAAVQDETGDTVPLSQLIVALGEELKRAARAGAASGEER